MPNKKPRRGFLINELLGEMVQEGAGTSSSTSKTAKDYVRKLDSTIEHVPRFQYSKAKSRFSIEDVPAAANPEGLLAGIFQYSIDAAVADSRERGIHPTHLGCLISSPLLTGGDIPIPIRQITDNTVNTILNQFVKVAQSKKQQNVTLWGEPFTVVVTTVNRPGLPTKRTLKGGVRRALAPVRHRINDRSLIKINNPDERNYCLFYALQATMVAKSRGWASWKFLDYVHSRHGQQGCLQRDALQLLQQIGARPGLNAYDAEIVVPRVVDHWNNTQQRHRFAVFIFGSSGQYKPLYKYINNYYDTPIALYLNNGHFDCVKKEYGLFGQHYSTPSDIKLLRSIKTCTNATNDIVRRATTFTTWNAVATFSKLNRKKMTPTGLWLLTWRLCNTRRWTPTNLRRGNIRGRFSLRNFGLSQTLITDDPVTLAEYLDNKSIEVTSIDQLDETHILITYLHKKDWIDEHACSNIVISLWTTSAARLVLLKAMQKVVRSPGSELLYTDTDSLILVHPEERCPLKTGPHLGQFTDEYPDHDILEFCSEGAKQYGLCLRRKGAGADAEKEYVLKVRGLTLNYDVINNQGMRYETFKEEVVRYATTGDYEPIIVTYPNFLRPNIREGGRVVSMPLQKCYRPYVGKGIIGSDFNVKNFGHNL
ncbi:hypothetical protein niasHS_009698 [Heterodera schachtii]|uniref:DNA-directed DNA polymerase n=1 Tax=Heterodera schachtii TaxID=97005 RepID=A0ABD2J3E7_HETSC